jgi:hypothetical protein
MKRMLAMVAAGLLLAQAGPVRAADPAQPAPAQASKPAPSSVPGKAKPVGSRAVDRLQLDTTSITGNRELPKVMSIVPWKAPEPPGGPDRPMGSLVEEILSPLDRDEFRREINYYRDLTPSRPTTVSPGANPQ